MAKKISSLAVIFSATTAPFTNGVRAMAAGLTGLQEKASGVGATLLKFSGIAAGIGAAASALKGMATGITLAAELEQTNVAFETMLGSADHAKALMGSLQSFAASTPFEFPEIARTAKSLLAFGVTAGQIPATLRVVGDVASGVGTSFEELAQIYGKAKTSGRPMAEDINQLTGRGIPIIKELAKQFGVGEGEVKGLVTAGKVGFPQLQQAFVSMTGKGGQLAGMMAKQSTTLAGLWSTLSDNVGTALAGVVTQIVDAFNLKGAIAGLSGFIGRAGATMQNGLAKFLPHVRATSVAIWNAIVTTWNRVSAAVGPLIARTASHIGSMLDYIATTTRGVNVSIADSLKVVGSVAGLVMGTYATWRAATTAMMVAQAIFAAKIVAWRAAVVAMTAATETLAATQAFLRASVVAVGGAYAITRAAVTAFAAAVAASTIGQLAWRVATLTATAAQVAFRGAMIVGAATLWAAAVATTALTSTQVAGELATWGLRAAWVAVRGAYVAARAAIASVSIATLALSAKQIAWRAVTVTATAAQWLLNAALTANPVGLVVVAVGALAGGLVWAAAKMNLLGKVTAWAKTAMDVGSYAMNNFGQVAKFVAVGAAYQLVKLGNQATHLFTDVIPSLLKWFGANWRDIFQAALNFTASVFRNMGTNAKGFFTALWQAMKGEGFTFDWTPLTTGFENTVKELPKIAERQIGELEGRLGAQVASMQAKIAKGINAAASPPTQKNPLAGMLAKAKKSFGGIGKRVASVADGLLGRFGGIFEKSLVPKIDTSEAVAKLDELKAKADFGNILSGSAEQMQRMALAAIIPMQTAAAPVAADTREAMREAPKAAAQTAAAGGPNDVPALLRLLIAAVEKRPIVEFTELA